MKVVRAPRQGGGSAWKSRAAQVIAVGVIILLYVVVLTSGRF